MKPASFLGSWLRAVTPEGGMPLVAGRMVLTKGGKMHRAAASNVVAWGIEARNLQLDLIERSTLLEDKGNWPPYVRYTCVGLGWSSTAGMCEKTVGCGGKCVTQRDAHFGR